MSEDPNTPKARSRLLKPKQPTQDQVLELQKLSRRDYYPALARLSFFPENRSRKAYMVVREIYLSTADSWWSKLMDSVELRLSKDELSKLVAEITDKQRAMNQIELWLKQPDSPLSLDQALKLIEAAPSDDWRTTAMSQVGKRGHAGQPASKRHLALLALDLKCAYPHISMRDATKLVCPCGREEHLTRCKEQLRQQVNRLVRFLREHDHDFRWESVTTWIWEPPE